jgi:hypothetical protein
MFARYSSMAAGLVDRNFEMRRRRAFGKFELMEWERRAEAVRTAGTRRLFFRGRGFAAGGSYSPHVSATYSAPPT